jgi:aminoglycoside phosphotransferase (APT) family kinase protein
VTEPSFDEIQALLTDRHGGPVTDLTPLRGGFWSSAYSYVADGRELVLRLGSMREGFEADRAAMAYASPDLPVPEVVEIGDAFGASYAISVRHHGGFLEDLDPALARTGGDTLLRLLLALRAAPVQPSDRTDHWREWLLSCLVDDPRRTVSGWRASITADPALDRTYTACEQRIGDLVDVCPQRSDLVHGDLLHQNVLITPDASRVTAVFSWKCSLRGDFLYDVAWCTFWGDSFYPGIAAADPWGRVLAALEGSDALTDAALRHHCYELHVGATHLAWNTWVKNEENLTRTAEHTAHLLERGPRQP